MFVDFLRCDDNSTVIQEKILLGPAEMGRTYLQRSMGYTCVCVYRQNTNTVQFNYYHCCCLLTKSCPALFRMTPWTVAHQAPLSMGFFRQEYCSGLLLLQGSNSLLLHWQADSLPLSHQGSPTIKIKQREFGRALHYSFDFTVCLKKTNVLRAAEGTPGWSSG